MERPGTGYDQISKIIGLKINDVIPQTSMIVYLTIIPRVRVGYEMVGSERGE